jgi:hypothetical protein
LKMMALKIGKRKVERKEQKEDDRVLIGHFLFLYIEFQNKVFFDFYT